MTHKMTDFTATMIAEGVIPANEETVIRAWQYLIDTGLAWQLQGSFGRGAMAMIEAGHCQEDAA
jgi:hypothetical protein